MLFGDGFLKRFKSGGRNTAFEWEVRVSSGLKLLMLVSRAHVHGQ